jgi:hypothetical protein
MQLILAHSPRNPTILSGEQSLNGEPPSHGRGSAVPDRRIWQSISIFSIKFKFSFLKSDLLGNRLWTCAAQAASKRHALSLANPCHGLRFRHLRHQNRVIEEEPDF